MNQHALRDIVDLTFWETDAQGKEFPAFVIDSLKSASIEGSAEATDLRGGRGNGLYTIFESQRDVNITCTDALLLPELFAARMGTSLKQFSASDKGVIRKTNNLGAPKQSGSGVFSIAINGTPKTPADMLAYITINGTRKALAYTATAVTSTDAGKFSYDSATSSIKVPNSELPADAKVTVHFEMEVAVGEQIVVSDDKFANKTYRVTGDFFSRIVSGSQEIEAPAQVEIPRAKFDSAFNLAFAPDGDPVNFEFKLRALKRPGSKELIKITMYQ
ncbi:hypothetical protein [Exiguobacterium sp. s78]|uniref:hypothetical protein n=1 Tax=Exiguobacterium sp. s78 TaxID=2751197 RepID=UPI001BE637AF|nr:hypothetical protein [Exiguobacterium sp. s78]